MLIGASVLPYSVEPTYGNVVVLLGREAPQKGYRVSNTWSDFGGRVDLASDGPCAASCAAREFTEETGAAIRIDNGHHGSHAQVQEAMAAALRAGDYSWRVAFEDVDRRTGHDREYVSFIKQVPWQDATRRFARSRLRLAEAGAAAHLLEKSTVRYFSLPFLRACVDAGGSFRSVRLRRGFVRRAKTALEQLEPVCRSRHRPVAFPAPPGLQNPAAKPPSPCWLLEGQAEQEAGGGAGGGESVHPAGGLDAAASVQLRPPPGFERKTRTTPIS